MYVRVDFCPEECLLACCVSALFREGDNGRRRESTRGERVGACSQWSTSTVPVGGEAVEGSSSQQGRVREKKSDGEGEVVDADDGSEGLIELKLGVRPRKRAWGSIKLNLIHVMKRPRRAKIQPQCLTRSLHTRTKAKNSLQTLIIYI